MSTSLSNQAQRESLGVSHTLRIQDIKLVDPMYADSYVRVDWQVLKNLNTNEQFLDKTLNEHFYKGVENANSLEECNLKDILSIILKEFPALQNKPALSKEDFIGLPATLPLLEKISESGKAYLTAKRPFPLTPEGDYRAESIKAELKTADASKAYKRVLTITWKLVPNPSSLPHFIFQTFYLGFSDSVKEQATSGMFSGFCNTFQVPSAPPIKAENFIGLQAKIKVKQEVYQGKIQAKIKKIVPFRKEPDETSEPTTQSSSFVDDDVPF